MTDFLLPPQEHVTKKRYWNLSQEEVASHLRDLDYVRNPFLAADELHSLLAGLSLVDRRFDGTQQKTKAISPVIVRNQITEPLIFDMFLNRDQIALAMGELLNTEIVQRYNNSENRDPRVLANLVYMLMKAPRIDMKPSQKIENQSRMIARMNSADPSPGLIANLTATLAELDFVTAPRPPGRVRTAWNYYRNTSADLLKILAPGTYRHDPFIEEFLQLVEASVRYPPQIYRILESMRQVCGLATDADANEVINQYYRKGLGHPSLPQLMAQNPGYVVTGINRSFEDLALLLKVQGRAFVMSLFSGPVIGTALEAGLCQAKTVLTIDSSPSRAMSPSHGYGVATILANEHALQRDHSITPDLLNPEAIKARWRDLDDAGAEYHHLTLTLPDGAESVNAYLDMLGQNPDLIIDKRGGELYLSGQKILQHLNWLIEVLARTPQARAVLDSGVPNGVVRKLVLYNDPKRGLIIESGFHTCYSKTEPTFVSTDKPQEMILVPSNIIFAPNLSYPRLSYTVLDLMLERFLQTLNTTDYATLRPDRYICTYFDELTPYLYEELGSLGYSDKSQIDITINELKSLDGLRLVRLISSITGQLDTSVQSI